MDKTAVAAALDTLESVEMNILIEVLAASQHLEIWRHIVTAAQMGSNYDD
jgi:hypothetical protein